MSEECKNVKKWFKSFIPLIIASFIFIFCFIFERNITLYFIMAILFLVFVISYIVTSKKIQHKDGYTYIQAMSFVKQCSKMGISIDSVNKMKLLAKEYEYSEQLSEEQILNMYILGDELNKSMQRKK